MARCNCPSEWHKDAFDLCIQDEVERLRVLNGDLAKQNTALRERVHQAEALAEHHKRRASVYADRIEQLTGYPVTKKISTGRMAP